jgi:aminopeptidase N
LYTSGHPILKTSGQINNKKVSLAIEQKQSGTPFEFPLLIEIELKNGEKEYKEVLINSAIQQIELSASSKIKAWRLDPNVDLLFEEVN